MAIPDPAWTAKLITYHNGVEVNVTETYQEHQSEHDAVRAVEDLYENALDDNRNW